MPSHARALATWRSGQIGRAGVDRCVSGQRGTSSPSSAFKKKQTHISAPGVLASDPRCLDLVAALHVGQSVHPSPCRLGLASATAGRHGARPPLSSRSTVYLYGQSPAQGHQGVRPGGQEVTQRGPNGIIGPCVSTDPGRGPKSGLRRSTALSLRAKAGQGRACHRQLHRERPDAQFSCACWPAGGRSAPPPAEGSGWVWHGVALFASHGIWKKRKKKQ